MDDIRLEGDEYVIAEEDGERFYVPNEKTTMATYRHHLTLTNKRIIQKKVKVKLIGYGDPEFTEWRLAEVKVVDGRVQARIDTQRSYPLLLLYMKDGSTVRFTMPNKKKASLWSTEIVRVLGGDSLNGQQMDGLVETTNAASAVPYAEDVAKTVAGTVDVFRSAFRRSKRELAPTIAIHCPNCGAGMKIKRGQTMYCQYCGSPVSAPE